jgi:hypothetical protein
MDELSDPNLILEESLETEVDQLVESFRVEDEIGRIDDNLPIPPNRLLSH